METIKKGRIIVVLPLKVIIQTSDILLSTSRQYNHLSDLSECPSRR